MFNNIIFFSHSLGQSKAGVELSPNYLNPFISQNISCYDVSTKNNLDNNKNNELFYNNIINLYYTNNEIIGNRINIGGDHSMAIATVANSLNKYKNLKVLWFDAHPDINTLESSISKNYHGMPLSFLTGLDNDINFKFIKNTLKFENLMYVGIRDIDKYEKEIIDKYNIKYINANDFNYKYNESTKKVYNFVKESKVHISFDVDGLDPYYMPSTGTAVPNGLNMYLVKNVLENLLEQSINEQINICNVDITELNLEIGTKQEQYNSIANVLYIFEKYFKKL